MDVMGSGVESRHAAYCCRGSSLASQGPADANTDPT